MGHTIAASYLAIAVHMIASGHFASVVQILFAHLAAASLTRPSISAFVRFSVTATSQVFASSG
jgi:hypothetical protein